MAILGAIFCMFLAVLGIKISVRLLRIGSRSVNRLFDKIEEKIG